MNYSVLRSNPQFRANPTRVRWRNTWVSSHNQAIFYSQVAQRLSHKALQIWRHYALQGTARKKNSGGDIAPPPPMSELNWVQDCALGNVERRMFSMFSVSISFPENLKMYISISVCLQCHCSCIVIVTILSIVLSRTIESIFSYCKWSQLYHLLQVRSASTALSLYMSARMYVCVLYTLDPGPISRLLLTFRLTRTAAAPRL